MPPIHMRKNDLDMDDMQQTDEYNIWPEKMLLHQNFQLAITVGFLEIVFFSLEYMSWSISIHLFNGDHLLLSLLCGLCDIYLLQFLKNYLENFYNLKAIKWINWWIFRDVLIVILNIMYLLPEYFKEVFPLANSFYFYLEIFSIVVLVLAGVHITKTQNDHIGLLKELGLVIAIILPIFIVASYVYVLLPSPLKIVVYLLNMTHVVVMILIYFRARKYIQKSRV